MKAIEDYNLLVLLAQTRDAVLKSWKKELKGYNISTTRAAALLVIEALGHKAIAAEIARQLFRESHTVSALLFRMEEEGLVTKTKDLAKKNMVRVALTKKGRKAYHQSIRQESIHQIMAALSEEERRQLTLTLETLRDKALKSSK